MTRNRILFPMRKQYIANGRRTPVLFATSELGHHEVKLCEAVLKSSKVKGWVKLSPENADK